MNAAKFKKTSKFCLKSNLITSAAKIKKTSKFCLKFKNECGKNQEN